MLPLRIFDGQSGGFVVGGGGRLLVVVVVVGGIDTNFYRSCWPFSVFVVHYQFLSFFVAESG